MRNDQRRPPGRNRQRFREVRRRERLALRIGLANHKQVGIARLNGKLVFGVTLGDTPFVRQVCAFKGLSESGGGGIVFGLRSCLIGGEEVVHQHHATGKGRNIHWRLKMGADKVRSIALREVHRDIQPL